MCGLTGFIDLKSQLSYDQALNAINEMTLSLTHRGPNDHGSWIDPNIMLALGHTRLSILDLTQHGHQPIHSSCGRYILVYNGEIYNHLELREQLNRSFTGHSDTETLVEALSAWGIDKTLPKLNGMFAFALWDRQEQKLQLVRDRLGIKPLYWGLNDDAFYFSSELKAIKKLPLFQKELNHEALYEYLQYAYVPSPLSIYQSTYKLKPGHYLTYTLGDEPYETCYWSLEEKAKQGSQNLLSSNQPEDAISQLEDLIKDAVSLRLLSDVPLGAFLSGGVDSSVVVAFMQKLNRGKTKTFSIGFEDKSYDESGFAKDVAKHLDTDHTELIVKPGQVLDVIPDLPHMYDEPFADSSQLPTFLVSQMAKESVTVALSGDGGDENFAGYNRHMYAKSNLHTSLQKAPYGLRSALSAALGIPSPSQWNLLSKLIPQSKRPPQFGDKMKKLADLMGCKTEEDIYHQLTSCFVDPAKILLHPSPPYKKPALSPTGDFLEYLQLNDTKSYLPDDILTKVDRASMAVGLEARVPLLDYRVVEFAWRIPVDLKIRENSSKWILRQILYKHVPKNLIERPKMGFSLPIDQWLRGPLKEWIHDLLDPSKMCDLFETREIQRILHAHMSGKANFQHQLWALVIFQQWREADI